VGSKESLVATLISVEIETPQPCINTDVPVLLLEDGTRQSKKMRLRCGIYTSYGYLPQPSSPEGGHLPWVDFCEAEFDALFA
jgi:hypothetical protein